MADPEVLEGKVNTDQKKIKKNVNFFQKWFIFGYFPPIWERFGPFRDTGKEQRNRDDDGWKEREREREREREGERERERERERGKKKARERDAVDRSTTLWLGNTTESILSESLEILSGDSFLLALFFYQQFFEHLFRALFPPTNY